MSELLPRKPPVDAPGTEQRVVAVEDDDAAAVFDVLGSDTARAVLVALYDAPATQSDLADRLGQSLQNVNHHVNRLVDAGLVTDAGQWYSETGTPMDVYAPTDESLVLVAGGAQSVADGCRPASTRQAADAPRNPGD